ncbi:MAG: tRNA (N6-threonylcarbamoyladenosine(37)-N6)-methyltransferase TrmO [Desulfobacterales bacterium]|nr:tRNA (N6-threonylcarbamoyladenosine(37)-N6)-methyltransferase TrmO [Desulfobacterales bacterium]
MDITITPIATLETCFKEKFGIPRQMNLVEDAPAILTFSPECAREEAVRGLEGFSHIWLIFAFHKNIGKDWSPMVRPPRLGGNKKVGVFASRSPFRPNPLGMSVVRLHQIETGPKGPRLHLRGVDLLDGTPVIDIKPYIPYADALPSATGGFAPVPPQPMAVRFSQAARVQCQQRLDQIPDLEKIIIQILENDPRPAYRDDVDPERIYGIRLFDFDMKWAVDHQGIQVISLEPIH